MKTFIKILSDHYYYRKQIVKLAKSDILKTYRGAALGWIWALIKPVCTIAVFWFAFTIGLRSGTSTTVMQGGREVVYSFFLWMLPGMVPWFYMSEMLSQGAESIRSHRHLVTKVRFPVSTIPTFVSISKLLINLGLILIMILIYAFFGHPMDIYYVQLPLYILGMFLIFTFLSLLNGCLSAISRDYVNLIKSIITPLFWLSGILWNPSTITIPWLRTLLLFNPITYIVTGFRNTMVYKKWFFEDQGSGIGFLLVLSCTIVLAIIVYRKTRKDLPDVL